MQPMKVGYMRVSTPSQKFDIQEDALKKAGCEQIFQDVASGKKSKRPGLDEMLRFIRKGDAVVVWKIDRLGRDLKHLFALSEQFARDGVDLISTTQSIDTSTAMGRMIFGLLGVLAEFERELTAERAQAGREAARARGQTGGRSRSLTVAQTAQLQAMSANKDIPIKEICKTLGISRRTFYNYRQEGK